MSTTPQGLQELLEVIARAKPLPAASARYTPPAVRERLGLRDYGLDAIRRAPSLKDQIRDLAAGAPTPSSGALGTLGRVAGTTLRPVLGAVEMLGVPGRAVISTLGELRDAIDDSPSTKASLDDWRRQIDDPRFGFGTVVPMKGWTGRFVGLAGDIAFDPLTYMTFGANTVFGNIPRRFMSEVVNEAGERLSTRALIGSKTVVNREGRAALAKAAASLGASDNVVADVAARGRLGLTDELARQIGLPELGVYFFGGRVKLPMSNSLGRLALSGITRTRLGITRNRYGKAIQELITPGGVSSSVNLRDVRARLARGVPLEGGLTAKQGIALLTMHDADRAATNIIGREASGEIMREFVNDPDVLASRATAHRVLEGVATSANQSENRAANKFRAITARWLSRLNNEGAAIDPRYKPITERTNWFPWMRTDAANEFIENSQSAHAIDIRKYLRVNPFDVEGSFNARQIYDDVVRGREVVWFGTKLTPDDVRAGVSRLNQIAKDSGVIKGDFFETDLVTAMVRYADNYASQMGHFAGFKALVDNNFDPMEVAGYAPIRGVVDPEALERIRTEVVGLQQGVADNVGMMYDEAGKLSKLVSGGLRAARLEAAKASGLSQTDIQRVLDLGLDAVELGGPARAAAEDAYRLNLARAHARLSEKQLQLKTIKDRLRAGYLELRQMLEGDTAQITDWTRRHEQIIEALEQVDVKAEELRALASQDGFAYGTAERQAQLAAREKELNDLLKVAVNRANETQVVYGNTAKFAETAFEALDDISAYARQTTVGSEIEEAIFGGRLDRIGVSSALPKRDLNVLHSAVIGAGDENLDAWVRFRDEKLGGFGYGINKVSRIKNRDEAVAMLSLGATENGGLEDVGVAAQWLFSRLQLNDPTWASRQLANMDDDIAALVGAYRDFRAMQQLISSTTREGQEFGALAAAREEFEEAQGVLEEALPFRRQIDAFALKGAAVQEGFLRDVFGVDTADQLEGLADNLMSYEDFLRARDWALKTQEELPSESRVRETLEALVEYFEAKVTEGEVLEDVPFGELFGYIRRAFPDNQSVTSAGKSFDLKLPGVFEPLKGEDALTTFNRQVPVFEKRLRDAEANYNRLLQSSSKTVQQQVGPMFNNGLGKAMSRVASTGMEVFVRQEVDFTLASATDRLRAIGIVLTDEGRAALTRQTISVIVDRMLRQKSVLEQSQTAWRAVRERFFELIGTGANTEYSTALVHAMREVLRDDAAKEAMLQTTGPVLLAAKKRLQSVKDPYLLADTGYEKWMNDAVEFYVAHAPAKRGIGGAGIFEAERGALPSAAQAALQQSEEGYRFLGSLELQRSQLKQELLTARSHKDRLAIVKKWQQNISRGSKGPKGGYYLSLPDGTARAIAKEEFDAAYKRIVESGEASYGVAKARAAEAEKAFALDTKRVTGKEFGNRQTRGVLVGKQRGREVAFEPFQLSNVSRNALKKRTTRNNVIALFRDLLGGKENDTSSLVGDIKLRVETPSPENVRHVNEEDAYFSRSLSMIDGFAQRLRQQYGLYSDDARINKTISEQVQHIEYLDSQVRRLGALIESRPAARKELARLEKLEEQARKQIAAQGVDVEARIGEIERLGLRPTAPGERASAVRRPIGDMRPQEALGPRKLTESAQFSLEQRAQLQETASAIRELEAAAAPSEKAFTQQQRSMLAQYLVAKRELAELMQSEEFGIAFARRSRENFKSVLAGWELGDEQLLERTPMSAERRVWGGQKDLQAVRAQIARYLQDARGVSIQEGRRKLLTNVTDSATTDFEGFVMLAPVGAHRIKDPFGAGFLELLDREARVDKPPLVFLSESGIALKDAKAAMRHARGGGEVTIIDPLSHSESVATPLGDVLQTDVLKPAQLREGMEYDPSETWVRLREDYDVTQKGAATITPQREVKYKYFRLSDIQGFEQRMNLPLGLDFTDSEFEALFADFSAPIFQKIRGPRTYTAARQALMDDIKDLKAVTKEVGVLEREQAIRQRRETLALPVTVTRKRKVNRKFKIVEEPGFDTRTFEEWTAAYGADVAERLAKKTQELADLDEAAGIVSARQSAQRKLADLYRLFDEETFQGRVGALNKYGKAEPSVALERWLKASGFVRATPEVHGGRTKALSAAWDASDEGKMMARVSRLKQESNNSVLAFVGEDKALVAQYKAAMKARAEYKALSEEAINASGVATQIFNKLKTLGYEPKSMTPGELRKALVRAEKGTAAKIRKDYPLARTAGGAATLRQTPELQRLAAQATADAQEVVDIRKQLAEISDARTLDKKYSEQFDALARQRKELTGKGVAYPGKGVRVRGARTRGKPRAMEPTADTSLVDAIGTLNALADARAARKVRGIAELRAIKARGQKAEAAVETAERAYDAAKGAVSAEETLQAQQRLNKIREALQEVGADFTKVAAGRKPKGYRAGMSERFVEFGTMLDGAADMLEQVIDPAVAPEIRAQIVQYANLVASNVELSAQLGRAEALERLALGTGWAGGEIAAPKARFYADMFDGNVSPDDIVAQGDVTEMARVLGTSDVAWVPHFDQGLVRLSKQFPSIQVKEELAEIIQNTRRLQEPEILREFNRYVGRYTQFFKTYATLSPGFHLRNAISNGFMLFAAGGDLAAMNEGLQLSRGLAEWLKAGRGTTEMWIRSLPERQQRPAEIAVRAASASGMGASTDLMRNFFTQGKALNNPVTRTSRNVMQWIETHSRFMLAYDSAVKGMDMSTAAARVRRFLIDYEDVSTLDKALRQIIPFWMWTSRNLPLQIQNMWLNPKAYAIYGHIKRNFSEEDDSTAVPEWMREMGVFRLPFGKSLYAQPDLPFTRLQQDVEMLEDPTRLLSNVTPLIRLPIELAGDRQLYSGRRFSETPVPVSGSLQANILQPLLQIAGYGETGPTGQKFVSDKAYYALRNLIPFLGMAERLSPSIPTYQERAGSNPLYGFLGLPVREVTPQMESSELRRRRAMIQDAMRQFMATGNQP